MSHPRQIMLEGGPMDGVCHELWLENNVMPERVGLPVDEMVPEHERKIAWYKVSPGKGVYLYTKYER